MITDGSLTVGANADAWLARVVAAARAGAHLIQIRERQLDDRNLTAVVARSVVAVRDTRARVIVNDRLDVAVACGAHGVQLRSDSFPAGRGRAVTPPGFLIGRSIHSAAEAAAASAIAEAAVTCSRGTGRRLRLAWAARPGGLVATSDCRGQQAECHDRNREEARPTEAHRPLV